MILLVYSILLSVHYILLSVHYEITSMEEQSYSKQFGILITLQVTTLHYQIPQKKKKNVKN